MTLTLSPDPRNVARRAARFERTALAVIADCRELRQSIFIRRLRLMALAEAFATPVLVMGSVH